MTQWERLEIEMGERTVTFVPDQIWEESPGSELYRRAVEEVDRVIGRKAGTAFLLLSARGQETEEDTRAAAGKLHRDLGRRYRYYLEGKVLRIFLFYYGNGTLLGKEVRAEGLPDPSLLPCDEGDFSGGTAVFPCRYFPPGTGRERRMPVMLRLYREKRCSQGEETFLPGELAERGSVALLHEGREIGCGHLEFSGERQLAAKGKFFCELVF